MLSRWTVLFVLMSAWTSHPHLFITYNIQQTSHCILWQERGSDKDLENRVVRESMRVAKDIVFHEVLWIEREKDHEGNKGRQCEIAERNMRHNLKRTMKGIKVG